MNETSRNNTSLFLLYMVGLGDADVYPMGMKMCYLDDNGFDNDYKNCLFLLFEPMNTNNFDHYLTFHLRKKPGYVTDYSVDEFSRMVVLKIPNMYVDDVKWFKKGKLSKMSPQYMKSTFESGDLRYLAYIKHPSYKAKLEEDLAVTIDDDKDLWSAPQPEQEIFRYNSEVFKKKGW